jgi:hypothetical protein
MMEPNTFQENNVHELYPNRSDIVGDRDSWKVMFDKLSTDVTNLWDRQSRLVATELDEKVTTIKGATASMGIGGVLMFIGVFCLAQTLILGLATVMAAWIAGAIVTVALLLIGLVLLKGGQKKIAAKDLKPTHSIEALSEIKNTFRERIYEFKRG